LEDDSEGGAERGGIIGCTADWAGSVFRNRPCRTATARTVAIPATQAKENIHAGADITVDIMVAAAAGAIAGHSCVLPTASPLNKTTMTTMMMTPANRRSWRVKTKASSVAFGIDLASEVAFEAVSEAVFALVSGFGKTSFEGG